MVDNRGLDRGVEVGFSIAFPEGVPGRGVEGGKAMANLEGAVDGGAVRSKLDVEIVWALVSSLREVGGGGGNIEGVGPVSVFRLFQLFQQLFGEVELTGMFGLGACVQGQVEGLGVGDRDED